MVPKVACIGECMVEMVQQPNGCYSMGYGGDVANTGVYLARLLRGAGLSVEFISAIGDDPYSDKMRHFLAQEKAMFAKCVELYIITVLVNYTDDKYYESYRI